MPEVRASRWVPHPPDRVWQMVSDLDGYGQYTQGIQTHVVQGRCASARRECRDHRGRWEEDVMHWDEGRSYTVRVRTEADDYPFPLQAMHGTWKVEPEKDGSRIELIFALRPRGLRGWWWLMRQFIADPKAADKVLDAYEEHLERDLA